MKPSYSALPVVCSDLEVKLDHLPRHLSPLSDSDFPLLNGSNSFATRPKLKRPTTTLLSFKAVVFSRIPRPLRFGLLAVAAIVTTAATLLNMGTLPVAIGFGAMYLLVAIRIEIQIDPRRRTYVWRDGIFPLSASRRGPLEDFKRVTIQGHETIYDANAFDDAGHPIPPARITITYTVSIEWSKRIGARPFILLRTHNFAKAAAVTQELAQAAEVPVVEDAELQKLREELGPAAYDERIVVPALKAGKAG